MRSNISRILYLSSQFPNPIDPEVGVFSAERVRALIRSGCKVAVVAPILMTPPPGLIHRPMRLISWLGQRGDSSFERQIGEIPVFHPRWLQPPRKIFGWKSFAFEYPQIRRAAMRAAEQLRPQVILSSWLPDGIAACRLGKQLHLPVICIADGSDINQWPRAYSNWPFARDTINREASAVMYVSEALRREGTANGLNPRCTAVIHNSVDVQAFKPGANARQAGVFTILSVGRLLPLKGQAVLLKAFTEFAARFDRPAKLVLVGDGELRLALEQQAARLGILNTVEFAGSVPPHHMPAYYQDADLFCLPSFSEGLPCVVVEAMACGKPVVASQVGGVPEIVDHRSGILVPPGDPKALCEALLRAANSAWDPNAIRQRIVEEFSWTQWTEKVFQVIRSVTPEIASQ